MKEKMNFIEGQEVEVASIEEGLEGSLFVATVRSIPNTYTKKMKKKAKNKLYVEYHSLLDETESGNLKECVDVARVRPLPPKDSTTSIAFKVDDEVDAFYNEGWWKGVIRKVFVEGGLRYSVFFKGSNEEMMFVESDLRKHLEWVNGDWISSRNQETEVTTQNEESGPYPSLSGRSALETNVTIPKTPSAVMDILLKNVNSSSRKTRGRINDESDTNELQSTSDAEVSTQETVFKKVRDTLMEKAPTSLKPCHARGTTPTDAQDAFTFPPTEGEENVREVKYSEGIGLPKSHAKSQKKQHIAKSAGQMEEHLSKNVVGGKDQTGKVSKKRGRSMNSGPENLSASKEMTDAEIESTPLSIHTAKKQHTMKDIEGVVDKEIVDVLKEKSKRSEGNKKEYASKEMTEVQIESTPLSMHIADKHQPPSMFLEISGSRIVKGNRGLEDEAVIEAVTVIQTEDTQMLSRTAEEHQPHQSQLEKSNSSIVKDNIGPEHEAAIEEMAVIHTECKHMLTHTAEEHQSLPLQLEKFNSPILKDKRGNENEVPSEEMTVVQSDCMPMLITAPEEHQLPPLCLEKLNSTTVKDTLGVPLDNQLMSNGTDTLKATSVKSFVFQDSSNVGKSSYSEDNRTFDDQYQYEYVGEDERAMQSFDIPPNTLSSPMQQDEGVLPFFKKSPFWEIIESNEVFQVMPQQPHFRPLEQYDEFFREGYALGNMVSFATLMEIIQKLELDEPKSKFEKILEVLDDYEKLGFIVKPVRTRLEEFLRLKDNYAQLDDRSKMAQRGLIEEKCKVEEVQKSITELNMKLETLLKERDTKASNVAELEKEVDAVKGNIEIVRLRFDTMVASPLVSRHDE